MTAAEKAHKELQDAQDKALDVISNAANKAAQVIASAAAEALKVTSVKSQDDHDLLITLIEQVKRLSEDIKDLKNGTSKRIDDLETNKAEKKEFDALKNDVYVAREKRIRSLETKVSNFWITMSIYTVAIGAMITLMITHIIG